MKSTYIVAIYNRLCPDLNSSGPDDKTAMLYEIDGETALPVEWFGTAIRYIVNKDTGFIVYPSDGDVVNSIGGRPDARHVKGTVLEAIKNFTHKNGLPRVVIPAGT